MENDLAVQSGRVGFPSWVRTLAAVVLTTAGAFASGAEEAPLALVFDTPHAEFGERYQHQTVVHRFAVENPAAHAVRIVSLLPRSGDGWVEGVPVELPPGGRAELVVHQPMAERLGKTAIRIGAYTDERDGFDVSPGTAHYKLSISGFVQSAYDPEALQVGLGWVDQTVGSRASFELASREVPALTLIGVRDAPDGITVRDIGAVGLPGEGRKFELTLAPGAALGFHEGLLHLETNVTNQPLMALRYWANVFADVVPDRNPIKLSGGRAFETVTEVVELRSRSGKTVQVFSFEDTAGAFELMSDEPCVADQNSCRRLTLRAQPTASGPIEGTLQIRLSDEEPPLPLLYRGWVLDANAVIRQIDATEGTKEVAGGG